MKRVTDANYSRRWIMTEDREQPVDHIWIYDRWDGRRFDGEETTSGSYGSMWCDTIYLEMFYGIGLRKILWRKPSSR